MVQEIHSFKSFFFQGLTSGAEGEAYTRYFTVLIQWISHNLSLEQLKNACFELLDHQTLTKHAYNTN